MNSELIDSLSCILRIALAYKVDTVSTLIFGASLF